MTKGPFFPRFIGLGLACLVLICLRAESQQLSSGGILIKGHIEAAQRGSVTIYYSGQELLLGPSEMIPLDAKGDFQCWLPKRSTTGYIFLRHGDSMGISLYCDQADSISIRWVETDPEGTIQIQTGNRSADEYFAARYKVITPIETGPEGKTDTCSSLHSLVEVVRRVYLREAAFLEKAGASLSAGQYDREARDIFYTNLDKIVNSRFFDDFDFYTAGSYITFPPFILQDKSFLHVRDSIYTVLTRQNTGATDTAMLKNLSVGLATNLKRGSWFPMGTDAFLTSFAYRLFLLHYVSHLCQVTYHYRLGKDIADVPAKYAAWLNSLIGDSRITNWLVAQAIQSLVAQSKPVMTREALEDQLAFLHDSTLKEELRGYRVSLAENLVVGSPAPDFYFLDAGHRLDSLSSLKGKYVYINFWDSHCGPCVRDILSFSKAVARKYGDKNVWFLFISLDGNDRTWAESLRKYQPVGINGRIAEGWGGGVVKDYLIMGVPRHVIVQPDGRILDGHAGDLYALLINDPFK